MSEERVVLSRLIKRLDPSCIPDNRIHIVTTDLWDHTRQKWRRVCLFAFDLREITGTDLRKRISDEGFRAIRAFSRSQDRPGRPGAKEYNEFYRRLEAGEDFDKLWDEFRENDTKNRTREDFYRAMYNRGYRARR